MIKIKLSEISTPGLLFRQKCTVMDNLQSVLNSLAWLKGEWCYPSVNKETDSLLRECSNMAMPSTDDVDIVREVMANSEKFPIQFPVQNVRLKKLAELAPDSNQKKHIESTYPIIHERVLLLMGNFIIFMREFGTPVEKALYKDMSIEDLIDRFLLKRAVTFCGPSDLYKLMSGEEGHNGWESVGTLLEKPPLVLADCLSYAEMRLSAMLFVSGHTTFVNDGARHNEGVFKEDREREGVIIGLIGARLERKFQMEYEDILVTSDQNRLERGYGEEVSPRDCLDVLRAAYVRDSSVERSAGRQLWSEFYQVPSYTYEEVCERVKRNSSKKDYQERFVFRPNSTDIFDNEVFYKRISIPFDCALFDADDRARIEGKTAYLNVVGVGLGVWKVSPHQTDVFLLTFLDRLRRWLAKQSLGNIAVVNFAYVKPSDDIAHLMRETKLSRPHGEAVRVTLEDREPSSRLSAEHLLVTTYAWDGNALPGNEFWLGSLSSSGDPAAACSSQVAELHNAHVNARHCRASNCRVAGALGLHPLAEYCRRILSTR